MLSTLRLIEENIHHAASCTPFALKSATERLLAICRSRTYWRCGRQCGN